MRQHCRRCVNAWRMSMFKRTLLLDCFTFVMNKLLRIVCFGNYFESCVIVIRMTQLSLPKQNEMFVNIFHINVSSSMRNQTILCHMYICIYIYIFRFWENIHICNCMHNHKIHCIFNTNDVLTITKWKSENLSILS